MSDLVVLTVGQEYEGVRLDIFLSSEVLDMSRSKARILIEGGYVSRGGRIARRPAEKVSCGQEIRVTRAPADPPDLVPWDVQLSVVHDDGDFAVLDKPAGMVAHPSRGHRVRTLANAVVALWPQTAAAGKPGRPGIVHRLDADTSGLIVIAKTWTAHVNLSAQFAQRIVKKRYAALVQGCPADRKAVIDAPVGRHPQDPIKRAVVSTGRPSQTKYEVAGVFDGESLLDARPVTGRTHQIRVHLQSIGHPVIGDSLYGCPDPLLGRQFLHASFLSFRHPANREWVEFESPLPSDLQSRLKSAQGLDPDQEAPK